MDTLWRTVLRRPVEPEVRIDALARLDGGMSRAALLSDLVTSTEFERVRLLDDSVRHHGVDVGPVQQILVGVGVVGSNALNQVVLAHHS